MKGVIFDFNGTMFFDSDKQEKAWRMYIKKNDRKRCQWWRV